MQLEKAAVYVYVYKEGALSALGHDLKLEVKQLQVSRDGDVVRAELTLDSLEVLGAMRGGRLDKHELSAKDVKDIKKNVQKDVLETKRNPKAIFSSTSIENRPGGHRVEGMLDLHGVKRPIGFDVTQKDGVAFARIPLSMPAYGIKPFRALLGALKIKPDVTVEIEVPTE